MKILIVASADADRSTGVGGVCLFLSEAFNEIGHDCGVVSNETLVGGLRGIARQFVFALALVLYRPAHHRDVLDIGAGDGLYIAVYQKLFRPRSRPLLVARSHGLEHVIDDSNRSEEKCGNLKLSWKYPIYHGGFRLWQVKQYLKRADMALFLNEYDREYAIEKLGVRPETAEIVDNGIPDVFLGQAVSFEPPADIKIALAGSFLQRKGIDYSVPALNNLLAKHDQLSVTFFGTGVPADDVLSRFDPAVAGRVHVMPRYEHENLPGLLKGFHILLFPSLTEGFGLAAVEGMACGLAAVVSRIPGIADRLEDGVNAIIIPAKDQVAIESAIQRLIEEPALLIKLRKAGYDFAQGYSWRRVAESNLRLYEKAIERNSRKGQR